MLLHAEMNAMEHKRPKRLRGRMMGYVFFLLMQHGGLNLPTVTIKCCSLQERGYHGNIREHPKPHEKHGKYLTRRTCAGTDVLVDENAATTCTTMNDGHTLSLVMMTPFPDDRFTVKYATLVSPAL